MHLIRKGKTEDGEIIAKIKIDNWRKTYKNIFPDEVLQSLEAKSREIFKKFKRERRYYL